MDIKILYDNNEMNDALATGWGFSCLINDTILFDTGADEEKLLHNMEIMGINPAQIEIIIISHEHWDHVDGLWAVLRQNSNVRVFICPGFSDDVIEKINFFNIQLVTSSGFNEIAPNVFTTGEMPCLYKEKPMPEQSLVLKTTNGVSILTGCSHPGIIAIIESVKKQFPDETIHLVIGGFHLKDTEESEITRIVGKFKRMHVNRVAPTHCTGELAKKMFKHVYKDNYHNAKVGQTIEI